MPELPEVETIVRGLKPRLLNKQITQLEVDFAPTFWLDSIRATGQTEIHQIKALVEGKIIEDITRRGKMIIINLSDDVVILIHLKMTGQLIYVDASQRRYAGGHPTSDMGKDMPVKSTRAWTVFADGSRLYFNDQRKFGYIKLIPASQLTSLPAYQSYGPEPLTSQFTAKYLAHRIQTRPKITIKQLLLDQSVVAGVGNIYADESLFMSGVHPASLASSLSPDKLASLVSDIKQVLQFSIERNGTSSEHYVTASGEKGDMQNFLQVYRRMGMPCPRCGTAIERTVVGGRGTHYCPKCQRLPVQS